MPCLVVLQSLEACRSNLALYVLIESSVYCVEPLRYVFDTVERGCFFERQQVAEPLGTLYAPFEEGDDAIDRHGANASFCLVIGWENAGIMQEAVQFTLGSNGL